MSFLPRTSLGKSILNADDAGYVRTAIKTSQTVVATVDPTPSDDNTLGYAAGDPWVNETNNKVYMCISAATGNAYWEYMTSESGKGVVGPASSLNNSIPLFDGLTGEVIKDSSVLMDDVELKMVARPVTLDTTANFNEVLLCLTDSNAITVTLPDIPGLMRSKITVKRLGYYPVSIVLNDSLNFTIDELGSTYYLNESDESVTFYVTPGFAIYFVYSSYYRYVAPKRATLIYNVSTTTIISQTNILSVSRPSQGFLSINFNTDYFDDANYIIKGLIRYREGVTYLVSIAVDSTPTRNTATFNISDGAGDLFNPTFLTLEFTAT